MDTRALATALAIGRIAFGAGFVAAPGATGGRWIGGVADSAGARIAVRGLGIRDVAVGAATLGTLQATGTGGQGFKVLTGLGIACDVVDAVSTFASRDEVPNPWVSIAVAGSAAATGAAILAAGDDG